MEYIISNIKRWTGRLTDCYTGKVKCADCTLDITYDIRNARVIVHDGFKIQDRDAYAALESHIRNYFSNLAMSNIHSNASVHSA